MSNLAYLIAASTDSSSLPLIPPPSSSGTPIPNPNPNENHLLEAEIESTSDVISLSSSCRPAFDCAFSDTVLAALAQNLPTWGTWLPSLPRLPYWVTSLSSISYLSLTSQPYTRSGLASSLSSSALASYFRAPSLPPTPRQGAQPAASEQECPPSPPHTNTADVARGQVAYLLVAAGEDVRAEGLARGLANEVYQALLTAIPVVGSHMLQSMVGTVSFAFVGHLGLVDLAGAFLATGLTRITGHVVLMGLAGALDMHYAQVKVADEPFLQMVYMQRALLVLTCACVPIAGLWLLTTPILRLLCQQPEVSYLAGWYAVWLLPSLLANAWIQPIIRYLQVQNITFPMDVCAAITLAVHVPSTWLLVHGAGVWEGCGMLGAAMATSLSYVLNLLLLAWCAWRSPSWRHLAKEYSLSTAAFRDVGQFIRLGLPSTIIACVESWGLHALIPLAGLLPTGDFHLAVFTVMLATFFVAFTVAFGFGAALSTRVMMEMGAGRPRNAKHAAWVGLPICCAMGLLLSGLLLALRRVLPLLFCSDEEVVDTAAHLMVPMAGIVLLAALQEGLFGVARGCGQQAMGAIISLAADAVGLAAAAYLAFGLNRGLMGLLLGMGVGIAGQSLALICILCTSDWADQAVKVIRRVASQGEGLLQKGDVEEEDEEQPSELVRRDPSLSSYFVPPARARYPSAMAMVMGMGMGRPRHDLFETATKSQVGYSKYYYPLSEGEWGRGDHQ
eukprot:TRINITY_DN19217_c0_g1_i1.p1 TRINITY_DN19217_c0_g1~~TRINITY_DN19217_c0_g1_i1.p1  ORF type:complete len:729 (+),score=119.63 TRINITY_DN19217_c0_g1_i1:774-2960(+)